MQFSDGTNPYEAGSNPYAPPPPLNPRLRQKRSSRSGCGGCLIPLLILALLGAAMGFIFNITVVWGGTTIAVATSPTLIIKNETYNKSVVNSSLVHIHAGGSNDQIHITPIHLLNIPVGLQELYRISDDRRTVIYDIGATLPGTIDITVPTQTNLLIDTNSTSFEIEGVTGRMHLNANNGELIVKNCHLTSGSVLSGNTGNITITESQLSGSVILDNNRADISFQGSLEPGGFYHFTDNGKAIKVTLPTNPAVHIDATTLNNGTITSNIQQVKAQPLNNGFELHTDLGTTPHASLSLYNNGGSIAINTQGGL